MYLIASVCCQYADAQAITAFKEKGRHGLYGFKQWDNIVIQPKFQSALDFKDGLAAVKMNGKCGYINESGKCVIPYKYEDAQSFSDGLAAVRLNGNYGYIAMDGSCVIPFMYKDADPFNDGIAYVTTLDNRKGVIDNSGAFYNSPSEVYAKFSSYARQYVEPRVNQWQKKGKYEKTAAWQQRVTDENRNILIDSLVVLAQKEYINFQSQNLVPKHILGEYDADGEIFMIWDEKFGTLLLNVPIAEAEEFERNFVNLKRENKYYVCNDVLGLSEAHFSDARGRVYSYKNDNMLEFTKVDINYNFDRIDFDAEIDDSNASGNGAPKVVSKSLKVGVSDVDKNIPLGDTRENTFAVIIANENYKKVTDVSYAVNDGSMFKEYCHKTLGLPETNVRYVENATLGDMSDQVDWIKGIARAYNGDASLIFYYAGHGIPDEGTKDAFLLPVDGNGTNTNIAYKLSDLYAALSEHETRSATVFLDACFSGAERSGDMLVQARAVAVRAKKEVPKGNLIVMSAAQGDETAYPYDEMGHGLFTYFLLKKLQESKGNVSLGELSEYIHENVLRHSIKVNSKSQTPTTIPAAVYGESWKDLKL